MNNRALTIVAALSLSLHIVVPPGFMPTNVSAGWFLEWCPDGMPLEVIHALFGHEHHHHGVGQGDSSFSQCDLSGLSADLGLQPEVFAASLVRAAEVERWLILSLPRLSPSFVYHSRAPPYRP